MRVLIQRRFNPEIREMSLGARSMSASAGPLTLPGFTLDENYAPVQVPRKQQRTGVGPREVGRLFSFNAEPEASTYLVRGEVEDESALEELSRAAEQDPNIVGLFSDPRISTCRVCPGDPPVGTHRDVENLLNIPLLQSKGMDGSGVMVAVVDTGVNMAYLNRQGKTPGFDASQSWTPTPGTTPGSMPTDHGTMCAFDACIAAPNCTLLDYALLISQAQGGSAMDGFLSDAVLAYSNLLQMLLAAPDPKPALVVNNSWGMFHPSWDFPVGHPGNYSDNPDHPFNIIVESLEDAGADILFAAGNCGADCPDSRCSGATDSTIYGANSHESVLAIAGVSIHQERVGYSSQGPGHLVSEKPDLAAFTHFKGSDVYPADGGTSAACPVVAGVVAAIRSMYSSDQVTPAQLRQLLRLSAQDLGNIGFDYNHGYGLIDVPKLLERLERTPIKQLTLGETVSGNLSQTGASEMYRIMVGNPIHVELDGPAGVDFDLYVRKNAQPTLQEFDYRGYTHLADEHISVGSVESGEYYIMVRSYRGSGDFKLSTAAA